MHLYTCKERFITYGLFEKHPEIVGFSTTRHKGYSEGAYATFNCTIHGGDAAEHVIRNRKILSTLLPVEPIDFIIPHQIHGNNICIVNEKYLQTVGMRSIENTDTPTLIEGVDALITHIPRHCICVSTADCVPILLHDPVQKVIAAVHSGWRGTVNRIIEKVVQAMKQQYGGKPEHFLACIGPSISLASFEVGDEVYEAFEHAGFSMSQISYRYDKWHIDLWEANRMMLLAQGLHQNHIEIAGICTYKQQEDFFSARRLGNRSGRILNGIMLL